MSDTQTNRFLAILGVVTAVCTITAMVLGVGSMKGEYIEKVAHLESQINVNQLRNDEQDRDIRKLAAATANIEGRLHGIASQVEKLPGQVAKQLARDDQDN